MSEISLLIQMRHNLWANLQVLDACLGLSSAQLAAATQGGYGSIQATLAHWIRAERYYAWMLACQPDGFIDLTLDDLSVAELRRLAQDSGLLLCDLAARDENRPITIQFDEVAEEWPVSSAHLFTQVILHATEHRTNATTILAQLGWPPFDLSIWSFLMSTTSQA